MAKPKALVLSGFGINSQEETAWALKIAGAQTHIVHFNSLVQKPSLLEEYQILILSGGWSFADNIQSGRVLANKFRFNLQNEFTKFVDEDKVVLGICNGFQTLTQMGAIPGWENNKRHVTLMHNKNSRFENRWIRLRTESCVCPFAQSMPPVFTLPIRHGEGQVVLDSKKTLDKLIDKKQVVFRYAGSDGFSTSKYPDNPNGSADAIAGLCNEQGNVMGLMPHPECHVNIMQNPFRTQLSTSTNNNDNFISNILTRIGLLRNKPTSIIQQGNCIPFFESIVNFAQKRM